MDTIKPNCEAEQVYSDSERKDEDHRIRQLRRLVDFSLAFIAQSSISLDEAQRVVLGVKERSCQLFPGKETTFDLLYSPRFRRLIAEKYCLQ